MAETEKIVIVGAGECGARAAFTLRQHGFAGSIDLIGSEPHAPYERPPLSKSSLLDDAGHRLVAEPERYQQENINLLTNLAATEIVASTCRLILSDGRALSYDKLLLATGARPRMLPGIPATSPSVMTLRTVNDAHGIRGKLGEGRKLVVIGGGFIGLELAASARQMGTAVTLLETRERVLTRGVPSDIAAMIAERHALEGVDLRCGVVIEAVEEREDGARVFLADSSAIDADIVVVGIGATPNVELAEAAGLDVIDGIAVDEFLATSDPDIYAAGDCCSFPLGVYGGRRVRLEAWRSAQNQGILAAGNMLGHRTAILDVPWFWSDQYDLGLQVVGLPDGNAHHVVRRLDGDALIIFDLATDGRLLAACGLSRGNGVARDIRVAEMMIVKGIKPDPAALAEPTVTLRSLLRQ
jgi:3-phenylpropionate/trans-cinnamate dioxygenase ferredoxin reductase component